MSVSYQTGFNTSNTASCGRFVGNDIFVYQWATDPSGNTVACTRSDVLHDVFLHELGHLLGLEDTFSSSCTQVAMAQNTYTSSGSYVNRGLTQAECNVVAQTNTTPQEQLEENCPDPCAEADPCDGPFCSPIVFDLAGDGFAFTSIDLSWVPFDLDADGLPERVSWTERTADDAFLVMDRNGNGRIDDGSELFGDATPFLNGTKAQNGYQVLFELDVVLGDEDGLVTPADPFFTDLYLWHDANQNGRSEKKELRSLAEVGIVAISTEFVVSLEIDGHGNHLRYRSGALRENGQGASIFVETVDVLLTVEEMVGGKAPNGGQR